MKDNNTFYIPGNKGSLCPFNGKTKGTECRCDNCDFALCCLADNAACLTCTYPNCDYVQHLFSEKKSIYMCSQKKKPTK